jgi:predicted nucleotide-binding protein
MAEYKYEQLREMTVAQLREIAKDIQHPALEGYTTMHKERIIPALCKALDIHMHHAAQGAEKTRIKAVIHKLQARRDEGVATKKPDMSRAARHQIHVLKRRLRRMAEQAD